MLESIIRISRGIFSHVMTRSDTDTDDTGDEVEAVFSTITENTVESVTEEEILELAAEPEDKRAYVGYEPSGVLHLGHMLTATKLIQLQELGFETIVLLADVHAYLNGKGTFDEIRTIAKRMQEQFVAFGLDPGQTEFVLGSEFQLDKEYVLGQHALALETTVSRAKRSMSEIASDGPPAVSQAIYPLMQAMDIAALNIDLAIGGMEQRKVHCLARDVLPKIGEEAPTCLHTPLIADLKTGLGKMSSSSGVSISMEDSAADIEQKIDAAFCPPTADPDPEDHLDVDELPAGTSPSDVSLENPVLQLFEFHVFPRFETVRISRPAEYGGPVEFGTIDEMTAAVEAGEVHPAALKNNLASYLDRLIAPGRKQLA